MMQEQSGTDSNRTAKPGMTAAERYTYSTVPEELRKRKEGMDDAIARILDFLALTKEFGEELVELGYADYSPEGTGCYDPEHVAEREEILGYEFAGELDALIAYDRIRHEGIRRDIGRLGKDFVKKVTALQQLMESLAARYEKAMQPFSRAKEPELLKFDKELRQRITDISYLTRQHAELVAAAQDAVLGDNEETNAEIATTYAQAVAPLLEEYEALTEEFSKLSRFAFGRKKEMISKIAACKASIDALNEEYAEFAFIDFVVVEPLDK